MVRGTALSGSIILLGTRAGFAPQRKKMKRPEVHIQKHSINVLKPVDVRATLTCVALKKNALTSIIEVDTCTSYSMIVYTAANVAGGAPQLSFSVQSQIDEQPVRRQVVHVDT